eukprot:745059-Prorocentrum_minimum.AAC.1
MPLVREREHADVPPLTPPRDPLRVPPPEPLLDPLRFLQLGRNRQHIQESVGGLNPFESDEMA